MDKHSIYLEELINTFDVAGIPEELYKIIDAGKIEFFCACKSNYACKVAELSVIMPDMQRRIFALYDYGYCMKLEEIKINRIASRTERDAEIVRLSKAHGLSQMFLAHIFKISQPTISLILKKAK